MANMNPPFNYPGGKAVMSHKICPLLPNHLPMYVEPFFGAGGIFFRRHKVATEYINDLNGDVVNFFDMLRDHPWDLHTKCVYTPYARELYRRVMHEVWPPLDTFENRLERAWRFWVIATQGRAAPNISDYDGGKVNRCGGWRPSAKRAKTSNVATAVVNRLKREHFKKFHERLEGVTIDNRDATTVIDTYNHVDALLYCDPPYITSTRYETLYKCEMDDEQHHKLLETILRYKGLVAISGYPNEMYDEMLGDWRRVEFDVAVSMANVTRGLGNGKNKRATEVLWMNYDELFTKL